MLALAACGSEDDKPADSTDEVDGADADEDEGDEDSTGKLDAGGGKIDAGKIPTDDKKDAGSTKSDASTVKPDAGSTEKADASAPVDSGTKDAGVVDSGTKDAGQPPKTDAGSTGAGACNDKTPHGCFTPAPGNQQGCPAQSPEIPTGYPSLDQWDGCNNLAVGAGASCSWNGPNGATATCICDTGVHWLCLYL